MYYHCSWLPVILSCLVLTVLSHKPPTHQEYRDIARRLGHFDIPRDSLPPGEFLLAECDRYECQGVTDASGKFGLACRDKRAATLFHDFIFIYLASGSEDAMRVRNTDMEYATMLELVECLRTEFLDEQYVIVEYGCPKIYHPFPALNWEAWRNSLHSDTCGPSPIRWNCTDL